MSNRSYRPRVGEDGDTIYENKGWFLRSVLPLTMNLGWYPFCNSASARNRCVNNCNKAASKLLEKINELAEAESFLRADNADMQAQKYDGYGVGRPIPLSKSDVRSMLPFTPEVKPTFKEVVHPHVVEKIYRDRKSVV